MLAFRMAYISLPQSLTFNLGCLGDAQCIASKVSPTGHELKCRNDDYSRDGSRFILRMTFHYRL